MSTTFTISAIGVLAAALLATLVMRDTKPVARGPRPGRGARTRRLTATTATAGARPWGAPASSYLKLSC